MAFTETFYKSLWEPFILLDEIRLEKWIVSLIMTQKAQNTLVKKTYYSWTTSKKIFFFYTINIVFKSAKTEHSTYCLLILQFYC